jgi:primase-polymerase (primpol)-like protein
MVLNPDAIPTSLSSLPQFVGWRYEDDPKHPNKPKKVPYSPSWSTLDSLHKAKSNDPESWGTFEEALAFAEHFQLSGIGFNLSATDGITGIDLDHVIQPDGSYTPNALPLIEQLIRHTYVEVSPSGTGLRAWGFGKPQRSGKCIGTDKWLEIYSHPSNRYLTLTGNAVAGCQPDIGPIQPLLDQLHAQWMAQDAHQDTPQDAQPPRLQGNSLTDDEVLEKARTASNGDLFTTLWRGDLSRHGGDHSSADLALCALLAFWTASDPSRIDALFRRSELYRPKWDERRGVRTYGEMTVAKAIALGTERYTDHQHVTQEQRDSLEDALQALTTRKDQGENVEDEAWALLTTHAATLAKLHTTDFRQYKALGEAGLGKLLGLGKREFAQALKQKVHDARLVEGPTAEDEKRARWLRNFVLLITDNRYADMRDGGILDPSVFPKVAEKAFPGAWNECSAVTQHNHEGLHIRHECYYPGEGRLVEKESTIGVVETLLNTYNRPTWPEPRHDAQQEALFLAHLHYICGDDAGFVDFLLNWMAMLIQKPGRRVHSIPVIIGPKGNGKSFVADVLTVLLGKSNVGVIGNEDLSGSFQDGLAFRQLLVLEEFKVFEGQGTMLERFKPWVTNERVGVNRKGLKKITVDNVSNTIAFSNHGDALRIDSEERRYAVAATWTDVKPADYYTTLFTTFIPRFGGSVAAVLHLLLHRDLTHFNPYVPAIHTESRDLMIESTWGSEIRALQRLLQQGSHGLDAELVLFPILEAAYTTARVIAHGTISKGVSAHRIAKDAKTAGIRPLPRPKRLTAGSQKQTCVYSTRNHEHWARAGDVEVREQFERQGTPFHPALPPGTTEVAASPAHH